MPRTGLEAHALKSPLARDGAQVLEHHASDPAATCVLRRVHRFQLGMTAVKPLQRTDCNQLAPHSAGKQRDGGIGRLPVASLSVSVTDGLRGVVATRYVVPLREGGSLPGLLEADDDGLYVTKFRGAGQGRLALVAEVIVGELARRIGLLVPELVVVDVGAALAAAEPDPEIQELIAASAGANLGVDFLPGALSYASAGLWQPAGRLAADVVWLDALVTNVDRSARNPNLLLWHGRLWLIDHGAALYLQHTGLIAQEHAARPFAQIVDHVLLRRAASILEAHERLAPLVDRALLERVVALVPTDWLADVTPESYVEYLALRIETATFAQEAERARSQA
jgi:HipA-like protein